MSGVTIDFIFIAGMTPAALAVFALVIQLAGALL